jgi:hypothetical protein
MSLVIASKPGVTLDFKAVVSPQSVRANNYTKQRPVSLDGLRYVKVISGVLVTNAKQALDTLSEAVKKIENNQLVQTGDQGILEQELQEFTARFVLPRDDGVGVSPLRDPTSLIFASPEPTPALDELSNVEIDTSPQHGDTLVYDGSENKWKNASLERLKALKEGLTKQAATTQNQEIALPEFTLEDALDVNIHGFPLQGQVLGYNTERSQWENAEQSRIAELAIQSGILTVKQSDDTIHQVDLKRTLAVDDLANTIIEAPRVGQKLAFDGHVWRNTTDEESEQLSGVMSFVSFPQQLSPYRGIELGLDGTACALPIKISLKNGVSIGSRYCDEMVADNTLIVGEAIGVGTTNPQNTVEIIGKSKGSSGLRLTRLAHGALAQPAAVLGIDASGDVVLAQTIKKYSSQVLCQKDGLVTIHHNLCLPDAHAFHITVLDTGSGSLCSPIVRHASANTVTLRVPLSSDQYTVTIIG